MSRPRVIRALRDRWVLVAILAGYLGMTLVPLFVRGAYGIARNDDWLYSRSLFESVDAGHLIVDPWSTAMVWGHILWAWPVVEVFGESRGALQIATAAIGIVALVTLHSLLRRWTAPWVATTAVALTALGPLLPPLAGSYMTDVPAFALQVMALEAGARALSGGRIRWAWWAAALGVSFAGFTIREYSVAVLAGLAAGLLISRVDRRQTAQALFSLGMWLLLALALLRLRVAMTPPVWVDDALPDTGASARESLVFAGKGLASLALLSLPALPWAAAVIISGARSAAARVGAAAGLLGAVVVTAAWFVRAPFVPTQPSYVQNEPAYWVTLQGQAPSWMPFQIWFVISLLSIVAAGTLAVLLMSAVVARSRRVRPGRGREFEDVDREIARAVCLGFLAGGTALVLALSAYRTVPAFDRYFLPLAPFVIAAVLAQPVRGLVLRRAAAVSVAVMVVLWSAWGTLAVDAAATNDGLRWSVGRDLAAQGWPSHTVDAGFEWWGAHQPGPTSAGPERPGATFWTALFPESPICVQASFASGTDTTGDELITRSARTLTGVEIVVVAHRADPACPRPALPASP